ncbi:hypothetical protein [Xanthomonas axonopodis]|uniref:hypothetical protein n=1 Tax=Xanthomonas axonopodis TaxID=53413 RepID=UPI003556B1B5
MIDLLAAGRDGLSQIQALMQHSREVGIFASLKLDFADASPGRVVITGTPEVIPPPISRRQKWNFLVPFPEEVP